FAGSAFTVKNSAALSAELFCADSLLVHDKTKATAPRLLLFKHFSFNPFSNGFEVACEIRLKLKELLEKPVAVGIESIINLLAPPAHRAKGLLPPPGLAPRLLLILRLFLWLEALTRRVTPGPSCECTF